MSASSINLNCMRHSGEHRPSSPLAFGQQTAAQLPGDSKCELQAIEEESQGSHE